MAYISKFKGSEIDSILTDVRNSVKPDLTTLKNNLSKSVIDINTEIEEINEGISSISDEISNIKKDVSQATTAINNVSEKIKEIDNKQDKIEDLATIRNNATKGVNALLFIEQALSEDQKDRTRKNIDAVSASYVISVFEEIKALINNGNFNGAIAILDEAILDLAILK